MAQKTAMQSLVELMKINDIYKQCMPYLMEIIDEVYLPMEKEQIINAFIDGEFMSTGMDKDAEIYYNEKYKK